MSGKYRPFGDDQDPVVEILDGHSVRVTFPDEVEEIDIIEEAPVTPRRVVPFPDDEAPTTPRQETLGLALALKLQASVDTVSGVLTSVEGVQSTWGRVETMAEIRKIRSILDVLEDLLKRHDPT